MFYNPSVAPPAADKSTPLPKTAGTVAEKQHYSAGAKVIIISNSSDNQISSSKSNIVKW